MSKSNNNGIKKRTLQNKFRTNVKTLKVPAPMYETKNVTEKRKRVRAKFTKNVQTRRR